MKDGVTEAELGRAQQGYLQQQQVARTSDSNLAATLADNLFVDRTMAYYGELEKKIKSLKPADVLAALKKHIDLKRFVVVDAGDFAGGGTGEK
jgi:zinc protease